MKVNFRKVSENAITPTCGTEYSAGLDLYSTIDCYIEPNKTVKIPTGISIEIPNGYFGGIYARSGLSIKQGLRPSNCVGVIDADYRGEVIVALYNDSDKLRHVEKGDRIAQLIIQQFETVTLNEIEVLAPTERGEGGFGSTGTK